MAVFARHGFQRARMDDIVEESGISKGGLYWYFKSKDDIIAAILDRLFDRGLDEYNEIAQAKSPVSDRLALVNKLVVVEVDRFMQLLPITLEFYAIAARSKSVRQALQGYLEMYIQALAQLIQEGVDAGEFRPVDAASVALSLTAFYEGLMLLKVVDPDGVDYESVAENHMQTVLEGLRQSR